MKRRLFRAIEAWLIRHRILATPEEDAYYAWADARLDELAEVARRAKQEGKQ